MTPSPRALFTGSIATFFVLACGGLGAPDDVSASTPMVPIAAGIGGANPVTAGFVVAILPFANHSKDPAYDALGLGLADMMTTDLSRSEQLTVVERQRLGEVMNELVLQQSAFVDPATAQQIGKGLGATHIVTGSLATLSPNLRMDVRLIDVRTASVVVAEQVTGTKERFFDLEQDLSKRLLAGLPGAEPVAATPQVDHLDDVAEYGRALNDEDNGDLQSASKRLASLVKDEPEFKLAQDRYEKVLRALMEAKKRRAGMLDEHEVQLLTRIDDWLASHDPAARSGAEVTFAYRIVRGELFIAKIKKLAPGAITGKVPEAQNAAFLELVRAFQENTDALIRELDARQAKGLKPPTFPTLPDQDAKAASKLIDGIPGRWAFYNQQVVRRDLANFLALGDYPGSAFGDVEPHPAQLDGKLYKVALDHCDEAIKWTEAHERDNIRVRESMRARSLKAEILVAMGHKARAMAELQAGLDKYPDSEEFEDLEQMLTELLEQ